MPLSNEIEHELFETIKKLKRVYGIIQQHLAANTQNHFRFLPLNHFYLFDLMRRTWLPAIFQFPYGKHEINLNNCRRQSIYNGSYINWWPDLHSYINFLSDNIHALNRINLDKARRISMKKNCLFITSNAWAMPLLLGDKKNPLAQIRSAFCSS